LSFLRTATALLVGGVRSSIAHSEFETILNARSQTLLPERNELSNPEKMRSFPRQWWHVMQKKTIPSHSSF
jgi:hypothetical protein